MSQQIRNKVAEILQEASGNFSDSNRQQLTDLFHLELANDDRIKVAGIDIDGILRGKVLAKEKFFSALKSGGLAFCSVIFGWDMHDKAYEKSTFSTADTGFSDILARIDLLSYRRIPWENDIPFFLLDFLDPKTQKPVEMCPRGLLKRVLANGSADTEGLKAFAGVEFEWFNFLETPKSLEQKGYSNLESLTPGMFGYSLLRTTLYQDYFYDIFDKMDQFGIRIEGLHTETGPGVYEAALKYGEASELADRGQLFKTAIKQLGALQPQLHPGRPAIYPSFMAKPSSKLPGCSGHLHLSLSDKDGNNVFYDGQDSYGMSQIFKHFIAGLLHCLPYILPMLAPNVNSYKRLVENYWAPVKICWGTENRTASIRVITPKTTGECACSPAGTRAEMRVSGADINTPLALAACFAAGFYGIMKKLPLPPPITGDVMKEEALTGVKLERLPKSLLEAARRMGEPKSVARELFGSVFVDHFVNTRLEEWAQWEREVTNWETKRYFELV